MTQGQELGESVELEVVAMKAEIKSINEKLSEILELFGRNGNSIPTRMTRVEGIIKVVLWLLSALGAAVVVKIVNLNWGALVK